MLGLLIAVLMRAQPPSAGGGDDKPVVPNAGVIIRDIADIFLYWRARVDQTAGR